MSGLGLGRVQIQMRAWTVVAWNDQFSASLFSNCPSSFCWWWSILVCAGLFYRMTFQSTKRATSFPYSPHFGSRPVVIRLGGPRISRWKLFFSPCVCDELFYSSFSRSSLMPRPRDDSDWTAEEFDEMNFFALLLLLCSYLLAYPKAFLFLHS